MTNVHLLTGNPGKIAAANVVFNQYNIEVKPLMLDIPEIQANNSSEIATVAALEAYRQTGRAVIREDHSFYIDALGMPGPFMAYIDKVISVEQLLKIINTLPNREGHFELAATYVDESGTAHKFSYSVPVVFSKEPRGKNTMRWERIIQFTDDQRTFAEYPESERAIYWTNNYKAIAELIKNTAEN
jgi:non-canonical purine NTP pyrophosphatase (RdgB/HAM1 family)